MIVEIGSGRAGDFLLRDAARGAGIGESSVAFVAIQAAARQHVEITVMIEIHKDHRRAAGQFGDFLEFALAGIVVKHGLRA